MLYRLVRGFSNYGVTKWGRVWSIRRKIWMKPCIDNGYERLCLRDDAGDVQTPWVHRLVALAYIANPRNLATVNHRDKNRQNNNVANLEWMSNAENIEHGQSGSYFFIKEGKQVEVNNLSKFCRDNNLSQGNMSSVLSGARNSHKGYTK